GNLGPKITHTGEARTEQSALRCRRLDWTRSSPSTQPCRGWLETPEDAEPAVSQPPPASGAARRAGLRGRLVLLKGPSINVTGARMPSENQAIRGTRPRR